MLNVISETKQEFLGTTYYLCGFYFQNKGKRLHRTILEHYNGEIPDGYHVHHKDGNRSNNDIANLGLMQSNEHLHLHSSTPESVARARKVIEIARIYAAKWRRTDEARRLQSIWSREGWKKVQPKQYKCEQCGTPFESRGGHPKYCSNKCKSAFRRQHGIDNEIRICVICGAGFEVNKYDKSECCSRACAGEKSACARRGKSQQRRCVQYGG